MNLIFSDIKPIGHVELVIDYVDGRKEFIDFPNTVLKTGREALAASLANDIGDSYDYYITRMIFGDGGTTGGATRFVNAERNGLFGVARANKPVISQVNPDIPSQVIFTSVITNSEANGYVLNEMALQMNSGDLYSMVTFPDVSKTELMSLRWSWRLNFI